MHGPLSVGICAYKPNSVSLDKRETTVIYLGSASPRSSSGTLFAHLAALGDARMGITYGNGVKNCSAIFPHTHTSCPYVRTSNEVRCANSTALHTGKDLAVSLLVFLRRFTLGTAPVGCLSLSGRTSLLAPRGLLQTGVTCYPFRTKRICVRTFLPYSYHK